jgi:hypothetical protein
MSYDFPEPMPPDAPQPAAILPDPSQPPDPQTRTKKNRRRGWIIAALVLLLVLITGSLLGFFVVLPAMQKAALDSTLQTYCHAHKVLDLKELESTFSAQYQTVSLKENLSIGNFFYEYAEVASGASLVSCTVSDVQQSGSTATATVTVLLLGGIDLQGTGQPLSSLTAVESLSLLLENGLWKVNDVQNGEPSALTQVQAIQEWGRLGVRLGMSWELNPLTNQNR